MVVARRLEGWTVGFAVFVSGAVLLGVELAASRVLAPFFGSSLFVWGSLISVVLAGLAVGYWVGGALADRVPARRLLVGTLGLGALAVLAVPLADAPALAAVVAWDPGPRANPLLASLLLFGPPSVLLAATTPIAVRLAARSLDQIGETAGRLFALSTAGSIAGTLATAFFLVPRLGTDQLLGVAAAALFVAAGVVALPGRSPAFAGGAVVLATFAVAAGYAAAPHAGETLSAEATQNWSPVYRLRGYGYLDARDPGANAAGGDLEVIHTEDTRYHRLSVVEDETTRYLRFDNSLQSAMYIDDPFRTRFRYTDYFHLGLAYNPRARDVLFIGLGAGSSPKLMWRNFRRLRVQVVELDPEVVEVGYRYFHVPRDSRLAVSTGDGRRFLAERNRRWDVIVIDAFFADAIPFHLVTREFLELARSRLAPGGVIVTNVIGALDGPGSKLFRSIYRTY
nr:fused MFS/spermidine synthase [Actinomycetota bacterium]